MISFPNINPTAFSFFGIDIQWYGIAYATGLLLGLFYSKKIINHKNILQKEAFDDLIFWIALGTVIGGRLGYVVFYDLNFYLNNLSLIILDIRKGGMSFHGGLLGVILSTYIFCKRKNLNFLKFMDVVACAAPIGIFFGRVTNFINSELWGKPTSLPWGVVFPNGGQTPRHPSQIYEAFLEGLILLLILNYFYRKKFFIAGYCASLFLILYGTFRVFIEFIREPDSHLGYLFGNFLTNGILLSLPMILIGYVIFFKVNEKYRNNIKKKY
ncbi:MAG: prolipoprotein diacylglyceryl transferase [Pelagibacterales bacterium]|nr:prolipoprotein diacylglyceryl transferase [Pelagibacterales bacterium]